ncbi:MAG: hypothetical protein ACK559_31280, partial [bacterium]
MHEPTHGVARRRGDGNDGTARSGGERHVREIIGAPKHAQVADHPPLLGGIIIEEAHHAEA